jgi:hypothetical protein
MGLLYIFTGNSCAPMKYAHVLSVIYVSNVLEHEYKRIKLFAAAMCCGPPILRRSRYRKFFQRVSAVRS